MGLFNLDERYLRDWALKAVEDRFGEINKTFDGEVTSAHLKPVKLLSIDRRPPHAILTIIFKFQMDGSGTQDRFVQSRIGLQDLVSNQLDLVIEQSLDVLAKAVVDEVLKCRTEPTYDMQYRARMRAASAISKFQHPPVGVALEQEIQRRIPEELKRVDVNDFERAQREVKLTKHQRLQAAIRQRARKTKW